MARAFLREQGLYVGLLEPNERIVLQGLMQQTRLLLAPEIEPTGDAFDDLVASMGLSLSAADGRPAEPNGLEAESGSSSFADRDRARAADAAGAGQVRPTLRRGAAIAQRAGQAPRVAAGSVTVITCDMRTPFDSNRPAASHRAVGAPAHFPAA